MFKQCLFLLIILFVVNLSYSDECSKNEEKPVTRNIQLHDDLLCNYNKYFVPLFNKSANLFVTMAMQIHDYYISNRSPILLHLQSEITLNWTDAYLNWNPDDYSGINEININSDDIWVPEIMPEEMELSLRKPSLLEDIECKVISSGNVTCTVTSHHYGYCETDEKRWPYDEYLCEMQYVSWNQNGENIITIFPEEGAITVKEKYSDWIILYKQANIHAMRPQMNIAITEYLFHFQLQQRSGSVLKFFEVTVIVLITLNLMCFWVNFENSNRIILALLNIIYHINEIQNMDYKVPRLGHTVPYILCFYRDSLVMALIILIETTIFKKILTSNKPTPSWLLNIEKIIGKDFIKKILLIEETINQELKSTDQGTYEEELIYIKQSYQMEKKKTILFLDRIIFAVYVIAYFIMIMILVTL